MHSLSLLHGERIFFIKPPLSPIKSVELLASDVFVVTAVIGVKKNLTFFFLWHDI